MRFFRILYLYLICSWSVNSQNTSSTQSVYECESPIKLLLSKLGARNIHSTVSILFDEDFQIIFNDGLLASENYFSKYFKRLNMKDYVANNTFQQDLISFGHDPLHAHYLILIPKMSETAINLLNTIGLAEKEFSSVRKVYSYIIWPTTCSSSPNCFNDQISQMEFKNLPSVSSENYVVHCEMSPGSPTNVWHLYNIHSIGRERSTLLTKMSWENMYSSYFLKKNFHNMTIQAVIPTQDKVMKEELFYEIKNGIPILKDGLNYDVMAYLQQVLNFSLSFTISSELFAQNEQQKWIGLAGKLLNDEADISLMKVTFLPIRRELFTFLVPHFVEGIQAFFKQPPPSSIRNIFFQPFTKELWITLIVVWTLIVFSNITAAKLKSIYEQLPRQDEEISKDSLLLSIAFTCQQGWHIDPQTVSMKIIFFCGSLCGLIVYVAYSAALVSSLSTAVVPIKKFANVLQNEFPIIYERSSLSLDILMNGDSKYGNDEFDVRQLQTLRAKMNKVDSVKDGVGSVLKQNAAFLGFPDAFYTSARDDFGQTPRSLCEDISSVRFSKVPFRSGMIVQLNSPYKDLLNHMLLYMYEWGLMKKFQKNYILSFRGDCDKQRQNKGQNLGIYDLFTAYVIILSGYALSFTIFLIECLYFKRVNFNKNPVLASGKIKIFTSPQSDNYIF